MPTDVGPVSARLRFTDEGAAFELQPLWLAQPRCVVLHIPYFVRLERFETDATSSKLENSALVLSPDVRRVRLIWTKLDAPPISFETTVEEYKAEYARRYALYVKSGNKPTPIEAPKLLTAEERKDEFDRRYGPEVQGIAVGKPVTTNGGTDGVHVPERAVDGNAYDGDGSSWWAGPPTPRWLQVDLEQPTRIARIEVFPYCGDRRYYQYTVEISADGQQWTMVGDMSKNKKPSTARADSFKFAPVEARYVKVTMLYNSANPSVHLIEVRVFAAK
jgi:hypothetical protein